MLLVDWMLLPVTVLAGREIALASTRLLNRRVARPAMAVDWILRYAELEPAKLFVTVTVTPGFSELVNPPM